MRPGNIENPVKMARPAGFEPATPSLEVPTGAIPEGSENGKFFGINGIAFHRIPAILGACYLRVTSRTLGNKPASAKRSRIRRRLTAVPTPARGEEGSRRDSALGGGIIRKSAAAGGAGGRRASERTRWRTAATSPRYSGRCFRAAPIPPRHRPGAATGFSQKRPQGSSKGKMQALPTIRRDRRWSHALAEVPH
jgi:hypothetical protein